MKKTVAILAGVVSLGVAGYLGSGLWADPPATRTPQTKIAIINLNYVIKNYSKFQAFQEETKAEWKRLYEPTMVQKQKLRDDWVKHFQDPKTTPEQRETAQKTIKQLDREMQDLTDEAKAKLGKKQSNQLTILYKELRDHVAAYAQRAGLDLVLHYNDALKLEDLDSDPNVQRKMMADACMPLYVTPGMDISEQVLQMLNNTYKTPGTVTPAGATTPPQQPQQ